MKAAVFSPSNDASTTPNVVHVRKDVPLPKYGHWSKVLRSLDPEQRFHGNQQCVLVCKFVVNALLERYFVDVWSSDDHVCMVLDAFGASVQREALVRLHTAGLNHRDEWMRQGG